MMNAFLPWFDMDLIETSKSLVLKTMTSVAANKSIIHPNLSRIYWFKTGTSFSRCAQQCKTIQRKEGFRITACPFLDGYMHIYFPHYSRCKEMFPTNSAGCLQTTKPAAMVLSNTPQQRPSCSQKSNIENH